MERDPTGDTFPHQGPLECVSRKAWASRGLYKKGGIFLGSHNLSVGGGGVGTVSPPCGRWPFGLG